MSPDDKKHAWADDILAIPEDRRFEKIWEAHLRARDGDDPWFPVGVGIVLRDRYEFIWAEYMLSLSLRVPAQRLVALFELSVTAGLKGDPVDALRYLRILASETSLGSYQLRHAAVQHARIGETARAHALARQMAALDYRWQDHALVTLQFCDFLAEFPYARAGTLFRDLKANFPFAETEDVETAIIAAIRAKNSFLFLRSGDGEGVFTRVSLEDESAHHLLYRENRKEFLRFWFNDAAPLDDPEFELVVRGYERAVEIADFWGAFHIEGIDFEYQLASPRGVPAMVNILRKAQIMTDATGERRKPPRFCRPTLHYDLLLTGALDRILHGLAKVTLITCHADLAGRLGARHAIAEITTLKVPGEQISHAALGEAAVRGLHYPDRFREICAALPDLVAPGDVYLVAAGFPGKVYCGIIKDNGGIAIDIGAVADIWMGRVTRNFPAAAVDFRLPPAAGEEWRRQ